MLKWLLPLSVMFVGAAIFVGGFIYGVWTVGVPTQDMTPQKAAQEEKTTKRMESVMRGGLITAGVGTVILGLVVLSQLNRRPVTPLTKDEASRP